MSLAGFVRHEQVHVVFAIAARMQRLVGFLGAIAVAKHAAHATTIAVRLARYGVGRAVGSVLYAINGATCYGTGGTSNCTTFSRCAEVITIS